MTISDVLSIFSLPQYGLTSVFLISFLSATLLPLGSEAIVFGFIKLNPDLFWFTILIATIGNTMGGLVNYWMGVGGRRIISSRMERYLHYANWLERIGPPILLLSWVPVLGDPLCLLAGWLRMKFFPSLTYMALGKMLRYILATAALLWIPNDYWEALIQFFT